MRGIKQAADVVSENVARVRPERIGARQLVEERTDEGPECAVVLPHVGTKEAALHEVVGGLGANHAVAQSAVGRGKCGMFRIQRGFETVKAGYFSAGSK